MGFAKMDYRGSSARIAAKRCKSNTISAERKIASKRKQAELTASDPVKFNNPKQFDIRNSAAFDPKLSPHGASLTPLHELTERQCKWPLYRDGEEQLFCGYETRPGKSYCPDHSRRAYLLAKEVKL